MNKRDLNYFDAIKDSLAIAHLGFVNSLDIDEDSEQSANLRSVTQAEEILDFIRNSYLALAPLFQEYPSLEDLLTRDYGDFDKLLDRENLIELCFLEDYIFSEQEKFFLLADGQFQSELLVGYLQELTDWINTQKNNHQETQVFIKENFEPYTKINQLSCQCVQCLGDYRAKLRDFVFNQQKDLILAAEEELHELILVKRVQEISEYVFELKRKLDKALHAIRYRLKRGSLNKLESDIKSVYREHFSVDKPLAKVYREKLLTFFNQLLIEQDIKPGVISDEEYDRFFNNLNVNIWRSPKYLKQEFNKTVQAIMSYKRKDISATILRNYLGQFWLYSEARKINRKIIYHMGPTNSGKTYHAIEALCKVQRGCYLAPLRLLASELYDTMNAKGVVTTLLTGEEVVEQEGATHVSSTVEMAKLHEHFDCCVIDEIQMISDPQRGWAWTRALINLIADEIHICGDGSVLNLVKQILKLTGDTLEIRNYERMTELSVMNQTITLASLKRHDALVVFSRRNALKYKMDLENLDFKVSIVYGRLSPEVRREQARKFDQNETDIMVATDAIAMGMNLPIKRVIFSTLSKFIDSKEVPITHSEIKQIAGRAGRFQRFPLGEVGCLSRVENGIQMINEALAANLNQKDRAMVGPDLEIYSRVNQALRENSLQELPLSDFLRLFNTMTFEKPFYCVELKEMIELAEMVEEADDKNILKPSEIFGFACAPVNLGLVEHVQFYVWILNRYVHANSVENEYVDTTSDNIDYLETAIKCVELFQWLARHFSGHKFNYDEIKLLENKTEAIEKLNELLSEKITPTCSSCGCKLAEDSKFNICEECFSQRKFQRRKKKFNSKEKTQNRSNGEKKKKRSFSSKKKSRSKKRPSEAFKRG